MSFIEALLRIVAAILAGYLLGSIPSGVLISKIFSNVDPRTRGSGKTGTTNILRTLGPGPAALVLIIDVGKGVAAVLLARFLFFALPAHAALDQHNLQALAEALAGFAALLGHNYSIFIHFTGGRGVATGGGALLAMFPLLLLIGVVGLIVPILITRYVSLGSIVGALACAISSILLVATGHDYWPHAAFAIIGGAFVIFSHHDNIQRIFNGTERKIGSSSSAHPVSSV